MDLTEIRVFEEQKVGTLTLSQAIRIGAKLRPKCTGNLFLEGRSCALGAAYEGATGKMCGPAEYSAVLAVFPDMGDDLMDDIFKRNDNGDTREYIADWLESKGL